MNKQLEMGHLNVWHGRRIKVYAWDDLWNTMSKWYYCLQCALGKYKEMQQQNEYIYISGCNPFHELNMNIHITISPEF